VDDARASAGGEATMRTKGSLIVLVIALAVLGGALPAAAGDRPINGQITFGRLDPELGAFSIWAANPDGTHQRPLTHVPRFASRWSPDRPTRAPAHLRSGDPGDPRVVAGWAPDRLRRLPDLPRHAGLPHRRLDHGRRRLPPAAAHPRRLRRRAGVLPRRAPARPSWPTKPL